MNTAASPLRLPDDDLDAVIGAVGRRWEHLRGGRLLLTGGTGFIGKWLLGTFLHANRTLALGASAVVLSRNVGGFLARFPGMTAAHEVEWIEGDVRNFLLDPSRPCTFAVHAATDVVATQSPGQVLDTCIAGTARVLEQMHDRPARVLLLSSGAVYGRAPAGMERFDESWTGAPDSLVSGSAYGEGKRVSELMGAIAAARTPGLKVSVARCFAFVGPHLPLDKHFAIGNFIGAALRNDDIVIQGDGTPLRSYLYAADLAHWLWTLLFDGPSVRAFNVGGAESLSIADLARRVQRTLGATGAVCVARSPEPGAVPQAYVPALHRIERELGLRPTVSLDEAIKRTARWAQLNHEYTN